MFKKSHRLITETARILGAHNNMNICNFYCLNIFFKQPRGLIQGWSSTYGSMYDWICVYMSM